MPGRPPVRRMPTANVTDSRRGGGGLPEQADELVEFLGVQVRDGPVNHPGLLPLTQVEALSVERPHGSFAFVRGRPGEHVDQVIPPAVDECGDRVIDQVVQPTAG